MAESLPLRIYRIDTSAGKESLAYEALPVDLIFIFATLIDLSYQEYFDEFAHCKTSSLS